MHVSSSTAGKRVHMILKMINGFNEAILNFIMGIRLRRIGATLLGSMAGLSLTSNIIPQALEFTGTMESFSARWAMGGFAVYSMIVWGIGGRAAAIAADKKMGALILGSVGLVSAMIFSGVSIAYDAATLLTAGGAGMLYGAVGGMIIADALSSPPVDKNDPEAMVGTIGALKIFSYLKK